MSPWHDIRRSVSLLPPSRFTGAAAEDISAAVSLIACRLFTFFSSLRVSFSLWPCASLSLSSFSSASCCLLSELIKKFAKIER